MSTTTRLQRGITLCSLIFAMLGAANAEAFKLTTHIVLANNIAEQIATTDSIVLRDVSGQVFKTVLIDPQIRDSIKRYRSAFVIGALGADVYPDLIAGQMTTHPGLPLRLSRDHQRLAVVEDLSAQLGLPLQDQAFGWQTDDWLAHVRDSALDQAKGKPTPAVAFAYGYMLHAAMDTWAHSYVNLFTGDLFSMFKNQTAAARHVALEIYFKKAHAPFQPAPEFEAPRQSQAAAKLIEIGVGKRPPRTVKTDAYSKLAAPVRFVTKTVLLNDAAAEQYSREKGATHMWAMWAWWKAAGNVRSQAQGILNNLTATAEQAEVQLAAAEDVWRTLDAAQQALVTQAAAAYQALQTAESLAEDAATELAAAQGAVQSHINSSPQLQAIFSTMNGVISGILKYLPPHLRTRYNNAMASIPSTNTALATARSRYQNLREQRDRKAEAVQSALSNLSAKEQSLAGLRSLRRGAARILSRSLGSWERSIEAAAEAYIAAFEETARELMRPHGNRYLPGSQPSWPLQAWATCWGPAFGLPTPGQVHSGCTRALTDLTRAREQLSLLITNTWTPNALKQPMLALDEALQDMMASALPEIAGLVRGVIPHSAGATLPASASLAARMWDSDVSVADLHQVYNDDASELQLPTYQNGELLAMLRLDGLPLPEVKDPRKAPKGSASVAEMRAFTPVGNAYTLAQLTLLSGKQLNELVASKVRTQPGRRVAPYPNDAAPGAVLIGAIRSIDGNHQWRPVAPKLIRASATASVNAGDSNYATEEACRRFGYPSGSNYRATPELRGCNGEAHFRALNQSLDQANKRPKTGMGLWNDRLVRSKVFNCLFAGPLSVAQCRRASGSQFVQHGCNGEPYPDANATLTGRRTEPKRYQPQCLAESQISAPAGRLQARPPRTALPARTVVPKRSTSIQGGTKAPRGKTPQRTTRHRQLSRE